MKKLEDLKVAIVHDWLYGGGAEKVVEQLHLMFPDAPIYTSYCSNEWRSRLGGKVITGYLQHWPFSALRRFLPVLRQRWFRKLDLGGFDLVISSSGNGEAKFVHVTKPAVHVCYCHTPTHYYWRKYNEYLQHPSMKPKWLARLGLKLLVKPLRKHDYAAAQKVDYFIANSSHIQSDIKTFYGRDSVVIHPPVDIERFSAKDKGPRHGFTTIGRLVPYKSVDIIIEACNMLQLPLKVVGSGPDESRLRRLAGPTIEFLGFVPSQDIPQLLQSAEAFIFAAEEDFGVAPVEAMAAGTPVIAYKSGGALDYVIPDQTGEFFEEQTIASLSEALKKFKPDTYQAEIIQTSVQKFSPEQFRSKMKDYISSVVS